VTNRILLGLAGLTLAATAAYGPIIAVTPSAQADSAPTLGIAHPSSLPDATGFGTVRPRGFSTGSMATSTYRQISWDSWGGPRATGHGVVFEGVDNPNAPLTVVAFDLGPCDGQLVYRKLSRATNDVVDLCH
jgi:hypothetical protein